MYPFRQLYGFWFTTTSRKGHFAKSSNLWSGQTRLGHSWSTVVSIKKMLFSANRAPVSLNPCHCPFRHFEELPQGKERKTWNRNKPTYKSRQFHPSFWWLLTSESEFAGGNKQKMLRRCHEMHEKVDVLMCYSFGDTVYKPVSAKATYHSPGKVIQKELLFPEK